MRNITRDLVTIVALLVGAAALASCQAGKVLVNAFKSGGPSRAERKRIDERTTVMLRELPSKRLVILPFAALGKTITYDSAAATSLATRLIADKTANATIGGAIELPFTPSSNELQILWGRLKALSAHVATHPVDSADYVLMIDVLGKVGAVHAMAVNAKGEMVYRTMWNSHSELFKQEKPKDNADAARMVAINLAMRVSGSR
jgi:hypothetical protein